MEIKNFTITKRDGTKDRFSLDKIMNAIVKAFDSVKQPADLGMLSKILSNLDIHELIGVGGMANVYRCYDTIDEREVAIKILKEEFLDNAEFIRRFKNESRSIAVLSHPNIVKVYDVSFGDMIQYIVMEYIDGITLKEYIAQQGVIGWRAAA